MRSPCLPNCAGSACRSGQADERIIAHCGDCLKGQVSGSLDRPLIILLEQQRTDEAHDGIVVWKDADDLGSPLDFSIQSLDRICAVKLGPVLFGKGHVGQHIFFGTVHEGGDFGSKHFFVGPHWKETPKSAAMALDAHSETANAITSLRILPSLMPHEGNSPSSPSYTERYQRPFPIRVNSAFQTKKRSRSPAFTI